MCGQFLAHLLLRLAQPPPSPKEPEDSHSHIYLSNVLSPLRDEMKSVAHGKCEYLLANLSGSKIEAVIVQLTKTYLHRFDSITLSSSHNNHVSGIGKKNRKMRSHKSIM